MVWQKVLGDVAKTIAKAAIPIIIEEILRRWCNTDAEEPEPKTTPRRRKKPAPRRATKRKTTPRKTATRRHIRVVESC